MRYRLRNGNEYKQILCKCPNFPYLCGARGVKGHQTEKAAPGQMEAAYLFIFDERCKKCRNGHLLHLPSKINR